MTEQLTDESQSLYFSLQAAWNLYKNQRGVPIGTNCAFPKIDISRQTPANLHLFSICTFVYGLDSRVFHTRASQEKRK